MATGEKKQAMEKGEGITTPVNKKPAKKTLLGPMYMTTMRMMMMRLKP